MPVATLHDLEMPDAVMEATRRLKALEPGMVLAAGQSRSGKVTSLAALAASFPGPVTMLSDRPEAANALEPLLPGWESVLVEPSTEDWSRELEMRGTRDGILLIATLNRESAQAAFAAAGRSWVLAALDTPFIGIDVAYALKEMGVSYEPFIDRIRCIWSQLLVPRLCGTCKKAAALSNAELEYLFPAAKPSGSLSQESGCDECDWLGTSGRDAVIDVMLFDLGARRRLAGALLRDEKLRLPPEQHLTMQSQARELMARGRIGVGAYRDVIRRNPLLRSQNDLEQEQARSFKLGRLFDKFLSPEVKQRLLDGAVGDQVTLGEAREVTCLFCDIRGFTNRAELREPQVLFAELNDYFADVVDEVLTAGGTLDKFIGDAVMAVFGAPLDQADHAARAVECALGIRRRVEALNATRFKDMPIEVGIGINTGRAASGCVGTDERMEYTVLGDAINIAARLESKAAPGEILIGEDTRKQLGGRYSLRKTGALELKGKAEAVVAFSVLGRA